MRGRIVFHCLQSCAQGQCCGPMEDDTEGAGYSIQRMDLVWHGSVHLLQYAVCVAWAKAGRQARRPRTPAH